MTALPARVDPKTIADRDSFMRLLEQSSVAIVKAESIEDAQHVLAFLTTLEVAVRATRMSGESAIAASAVRVRCERRVGELLRAQAERGERERGGRPKTVRGVDSLPTVTAQGLTHNESSTYQRLAAAPKEVFDQAVEAEAERARQQRNTGISRAGVLRALNPETDKRPDEHWLAADKFVTLCERLMAMRDETVAAVRFGQYPADEPPIVVEAITSKLAGAVAAIQEVQAAMNRRTI